MKSEVNAVMLFIAELSGSFKPGTGTVENKIECGKNNYLDSFLHDLNLTTEDDRKDLHENVWLERLYDDLDAYFKIPTGNKIAKCLCLDLGKYREETYKWSVPIELDATSSMCQIIGALLNDKRLLNMTNVIGETLEDAWKIEGLTRPMVKTAMTPMLYGSSKSCNDLWKSANMPYTIKDIELLNKEISTGAFGLCNMFKDFIINNCNPKTSMDIKIGNDEFNVSCNRFRNVGENTKAYKIWDSIDKAYNTVLHTDTKKVPDLEQFRTYMVTLLIHNLDSQIMDKVCSKVMAKYGWGISLHDAIICSPAAAKDVRIWYGIELKSVHENRKSILEDFFKSIGITGAAADQWDTIKSKVHPLEGEIQLSMPLK